MNSRAFLLARRAQEKQMQRMLFELLDSHIVALLPEGAPEARRAGAGIVKGG